MTVRLTRRGRLAAATALALGAASAAGAATAAPTVAPSAATRAGQPGPAVATSTDAARPLPAIGRAPMRGAATRPYSTTECRQTYGISCYTPLQLRRAYDVGPLYDAGITGKGRTILIVDSFGSPTIQHDLEAFDKQFGLPDTQVEIVKYGNVPTFDPNDDEQAGWAMETTLDVEYAHAMAPDAHIILAETPVAETEGVTGLPQMMDVEKQLIDSGRVDVISQSFGATENTFPGYDQHDFRSLLSLRYAFTDAFRHGVTVLASSGDDGATDAEPNGTDLYPYRVNSWPSSDPLVTSVGGTQLKLDDAGNRLAPDVVWNDGYGAGGGGVSGVFRRPPYQVGVRSVVGDHRGTPDISLSAAVDGGVWVYFTFVTPNSPWHVFGGTSEASPVFSGIVALADQAAGHRLGLLNPLLYGEGQLQQKLPAGVTGLVDVTSGDNSFAGVTGYDATPGYDLASGWGTLDAARWIGSLHPLGVPGLPGLHRQGHK